MTIQLVSMITISMIPILLSITNTIWTVSSWPSRKTSLMWSFWTRWTQKQKSTSHFINSPPKPQTGRYVEIRMFLLITIIGLRDDRWHVWRCDGVCIATRLETINWSLYVHFITVSIILSLWKKVKRSRTNGNRHRPRWPDWNVAGCGRRTLMWSQRLKQQWKKRRLHTNRFPSR